MSITDNKPRPMRAVVTCSAAREDRVKAVAAMPADGMWIDLESTVPIGAKEQARRTAASLIPWARQEKGKFPLVRVNAMRTGLLEADLEAVVSPSLYAVLLPKSEGPRDIIACAALLDGVERRKGIPLGHTLICPIMESAGAVRQAYEIATASPRVQYVCSGTAKNGDLARSVGFQWTAEGMETLFLRSKTLLDFRAAGVKYCISGAWTDHEDLQGFRRFAEQSKQLGFTGLMCPGKPELLKIVNEVFTPSAAEIDYYRRVIRAMEEAEKEGHADAFVDGGFIDESMREYAYDQLEICRLFGLIKD